MEWVQTVSDSNLKCVFKDRERALRKIEMLERLFQDFHNGGNAHFKKNLERARKTAAFLSRRVKQYVKAEESIVFSFLEKHVPKLDLLILHFQTEHKSLRDNLRSLERLLKTLSGKGSSLKRAEMVRRACSIGIYSMHLFKYHLKSEGKCIEETLRHGLQPNERREMSVAFARALRNL